VRIVPRASREAGDDQQRKGCGLPRVRRTAVPVRDWDDFVRLAFEEIRLAGAAQPQIARGLRAVLEDLKTVAPDERQAALDEQRELLDAAVRRAYDEESVTRHARVADMQGLG